MDMDSYECSRGTIRILWAPISSSITDTFHYKSYSTQLDTQNVRPKIENDIQFYYNFGQGKTEQKDITIRVTVTIGPDV
jgi:hypothetical protein